MKLKRMKLKPIIAAIALLGLSAPAFAADPQMQAQLDSMQAQIAKMNTIIGQNQNAVVRQPQDWFNRITVSGLANIDGFVGERSPTFRSVDSNLSRFIAGDSLAGETALGNIMATPPVLGTVQIPSTFIPASVATPSGNTQALALDNANIFIHALVNDWVTADVDFVYQDSNNFILRAPNPTALDEGYVTIGNFAKTPVYFRAGRMYEPFGMYERYPMMTNPTQLLSETSATTAQLGVVFPEGFYGSIYALQGLPRAGDGFAVSRGTEGIGSSYVNGVSINRSRIQNGGADLGYQYSTDNLGAKIDVGYLINMADVNYVSSGLNYYTHNVGAVAASADFRAAWFDASLRYVSATQSFGSQTATATETEALTGNSSTAFITIPDVVSRNGSTGAKPQAYGAEVGFTFPVLAHSSRIGVGYQGTSDAVNVGFRGLPQNRWYADYMFNFSKWSDIGIAYWHDKDYSAGNSGTGSSANVGMLRLSVKAA